MKLKLFLLLFLFLACFCGTPGLSEVYAQTEGSIIKRVEVRGNKRIDKDTILFYIKSIKGEKYSSAQVNEDIKTIYSLRQFEDIRVEAQDFNNGIKLIYIVKEIPSIREITYIGNSKISDKELERKLIFNKIKIGSLYNKNVIKNAEKRIKKVYEEKGFFLAKIKATPKKVSPYQIDLVFKISENKKVGIKKIRFKGNKAFAEKELKKQFTTKEKTFLSFLTDDGIYQKEMLKADMLKLELFYRENGYINVKVLDPLINVDKKAKAIFITVPIEEGEQYKTGKIEFAGDDTFTKNKLKAKIDLKTGDVYSLTKLREGIFKITELYSQQGFAYAEVRPDRDIDVENKKVDVVMNIEKGRKIYIGKITITGNEKSKDKTIRREFRFREGGLFDSTKLRRSKERIMNTKFFEDVQIQTSRGEQEDTIDIIASVVERPTGNIGAGLGYSSLDNLIITAQVSQDNLFGNGQRIAFTTNLSARRTDFSLSFTEPWLFDREISAGFDVFNLKEDFFRFTTKRKGGGFRFGKSFTEYIWGSVGYRYENINISGVAAEDETNFLTNETRFTSRITPSLTRDTRDNRLNPTTGTNEVFTATYAGGLLGGVDFYKVSAEKTYYRPLFFGLIGVLHGKISYAKGYGEDALPIYERFFMGGPLDLRGFTFEEVGPMDSTGDPLGGEKLLLVNAEIHYPFSNAIRGILFYDRGNVYGNGDDLSLTSENYSLSNMRHSVGVAVQFYSPIGPIGLAYGFKLDKKTGEDAGEFHFILGRTF